jgi:hypothetical protein
MTKASWPFDNADTTETQYSYLMRELREPGVVGTPGDSALRVSPTTALGLSVAAGRCFIRGFMLSVTGTESLTLTAAHASLARIDRVVVRVDPTANAVTPTVITGTAGSASAPALVQTDTGVFDLPLVRVNVAAGQTTLSTADVTDERTYVGGDVRVWTTTTRPASPMVGRSLGYNTSTQAWEFWSGSGWTPLVTVPTWSTLAGKPTTSTLDGRNLLQGSATPSASLGANGDIYFQA